MDDFVYSLKYNNLETQPNDEFTVQEEGHDTLQDSQDSYNNKIIAQNLVSESSNKILLAEFIYKNIEKLNEKLERDLQKLNMEPKVFQEKDKVLELKDLLEKTIISYKDICYYYDIFEFQKNLDNERSLNAALNDGIKDLYVNSHLYKSKVSKDTFVEVNFEKK